MIIIFMIIMFMIIVFLIIMFMIIVFMISVREIMLNLDDKPTAIVEKKVSTTAATGWYTLDGRRLHDKPSVRGIYLNNGRKVFIK